MKVINLRHILSLIALFCFVIVGSVRADNINVTQQQENVDAKEIVFGHIGDSYEWHITTWGNTKITIPLPVIVRNSETGWHVFLSSKVEDSEAYEGFYLADEGSYTGKIVYKNAAGEEVRPLDVSITKIALALMINSLLLIIIVLGVAHWYKGKTNETNAPKGFVGFMEMFIIMVNDDVIKSCVGKDYRKYAPYLLTVFFFIFLNNIMGLIPIFPGGANVTGNIAITLILALCTFLVVNFSGNKEYWKDIFWPHVPLWLKLPIPLMPVVELFGVFTKPFALMIRLFANIMAGHSVILALTSLIFVTISMGPEVNGAMTVVSVLFGIFMNCLELLVAFIQAYVFTMLSAVFIGLAKVEKPSRLQKEEVLK